jgi:hypothetical protein
VACALSCGCEEECQAPASTGPHELPVDRTGRLDHPFSKTEEESRSPARHYSVGSTALTDEERVQLVKAAGTESAAAFARAVVLRYLARHGK